VLGTVTINGNLEIALNRALRQIRPQVRFAPSHPAVQSLSPARRARILNRGPFYRGIGNNWGEIRRPVQNADPIGEPSIRETPSAACSARANGQLAKSWSRRRKMSATRFHATFLRETKETWKEREREREREREISWRKRRNNDRITFSSLRRGTGRFSS